VIGLALARGYVNRKMQTYKGVWAMINYYKWLRYKEIVDYETMIVFFKFYKKLKNNHMQYVYVCKNIR
jgi:hypothetical protein